MQMVCRATCLAITTYWVKVDRREKCAQSPGYSNIVVLEEEYPAKAIVRKWMESSGGNLKVGCRQCLVEEGSN